MHKRLFVVDIVKVFFLSLIILYDGYAAIWSELKDWPLGKSFLFDSVYLSLHSFCFAGFVVLAAFAFLAGYRGGKIQLKNLIILVVFGAVIVSFSEGGFTLSSLWVEWDIYQYLMVNIICLYVCARTEKLGWALGLIGLAMFFIPWGNVAFDWNLSVDARRVLTGYCNQDGRGGWHLLPWIGLSWVMYSFGRITAKSPMESKWEFALWAPTLTYCVLNWGAYSYPPLSLGFYCFVFSRSPVDFWIQMLPVLFLFRLSTNATVQNFFIQHPRLQFFSNLYLAKKLGLAFILHIFVSYVFGAFDVEIRNHPLLSEIYFLILLPIIEGLTRFSDWTIRRLTVK